MKRFIGRCAMVILISLFAVASADSEEPVHAILSDTPLDRSFHDMYNLDFPDALKEAAAYQKQNPDNPMGAIAEAAALLFSEFDRLHVLQSEFFATDEGFAARNKLTPDPNVKARFEAALTLAEQKAQINLEKERNQSDSLFALALMNGLRADYTALIEKRDLAAFSYTKTASSYADKLLAIAPDYYDGYMAAGIGKYIVGLKPAPVRWMLRLTGFKADRDEGLKNIRIAAEKGRLFAPFARLVLAVAHLREKQKKEAYAILVSLRDQFPGNALFAQEAAKLQ